MPLQDFDENIVELEIAEGLEQIALDELLAHYTGRIITRPIVEPGMIRVGYVGNLGGLMVLGTVNAVYLLRVYNIPRPKAFLGHEHFTRLVDQIETARSLGNPDDYETLHISAAGSGSSVMQRLLDELGRATGLTPDAKGGDLLLRLRRAAHGDGWDALVRLSPRPNATRPWRIVNVPGALNAAVARAMIQLSEPEGDEIVMNLACGSGSLAIERAAVGPASAIYACDTDLEMVDATLKNVEAAGLTDRIEVRAWDATDVPMSTGSVDVIYADLPFGHLVGSHDENIHLYPAIFKEAARLVKRGGKFVVITHEVRLTGAVLIDVDKWTVDHELMITLSGLHPRIYVLTRI